MRGIIPPERPKRVPTVIPIGLTGYASRLPADGTTRPIELTPSDGSIPADIGAKDLETFEYQLHYTTGNKR